MQIFPRRGIRTWSSGNLTFLMLLYPTFHSVLPWVLTKTGCKTPPDEGHPIPWAYDTTTGIIPFFQHESLSQIPIVSWRQVRNELGDATFRGFGVSGCWFGWSWRIGWTVAKMVPDFSSFDVGDHGSRIGWLLSQLGWCFVEAGEVIFGYLGNWKLSISPNNKLHPGNAVNYGISGIY